MMLSNLQSGYPDGNDSSNGQLLRDIEEISKALYVDYKPPQNSMIPSSKLGPKSVKKSRFADMKSKPRPAFDDDCIEKHKPSSIWGWKPFKALSHIRRRKFTCCFFCHVDCIENLPPDFDDVCMSVYWKRKDTMLSTRLSRVSNGVVEFEETLMNKCAVYCMKNGTGNFVKYEPKHFLLYTSVAEAAEHDVGRHWVDLTRLLPLTNQELEEDKCSGKWSTSFKLTGKAKGATLHVSFGFLVMKNDLAELGCTMRLPHVLNLEKNGVNRMSFAAVDGVDKGTMLRRTGSVPSSLRSASFDSSRCLDVMFSLPKDVSDFSSSINVLYGKLEEGNKDLPAKLDVVFEQMESLNLVPDSLSVSAEDISKVECDDAEFTVIEKGIELEQAPEEEIKLDVSAVQEADVSTVEVIDVADIFSSEGISSDEETKSNGKDEACGCAANETVVDHKKESDSEIEVLDLSVDEIFFETVVNCKRNKMVKSLSLDDITKAVADDFFNLLQETNTPSTMSSNENLESPRERLLREFEEDVMTSGNFYLDLDIQEDDIEPDLAASSVLCSDLDIEGIDLLPTIDTTGDVSFQQTPKSKMKAKLLERLETESLMQRWGLNEEAFEDSPHHSMGGFGSPIYVPREEPVGLPPLGEGLDSLIHLKNGGILRSMSPLLFQNAKNCGRLVMQASDLVVLPAELGSDIIEILQCMASVRIENLSQKVHKLMSLEELSGRIIQQLAWEGLCKEDSTSRTNSPQREPGIENESEGSTHFLDSSPTRDMDSEYTSTKDLTPLVLSSIEALVIEGLKIQSGMSNHNPPSFIRVKSVSEGTYENWITYSHESFDLSGDRGSANDVDVLLDFTISLDEWLRLDSGIFGEPPQVGEHTSKVLAAHQAKPSYSSNRKSDGEENMHNESEKYGIMGDSVTVALMIQLRDPLRNFEPVGAPMLGLIQVTRVLDNLEDGRDGITRFTVNEVHVAGLNTGSSVPEFWASKRHQQAGSRWLLASGLTKNCDGHFSRSSSTTALSTQVLRNRWSQNLLWSISRATHGTIADPTELLMEGPLTRNPDVIFPK